MCDDRGSSYVSVRGPDITRESTFQKDSDETTKDLCTYCVGIEDTRNVANYFCPDCGPVGRFLCDKCLKYHKQFRKSHVSVKSFAVVKYGLRLGSLSEEKTEAIDSETETESPQSTIHPHREISTPKGPISKLSKDDRIDFLQQELKKTEIEVALLRQKLEQTFKDVKERMTVPNEPNKNEFEGDDDGDQNEETDGLLDEYLIPNHQQGWERVEKGVIKETDNVSDTTANIPSSEYERNVIGKDLRTTVVEQFENLLADQWEDAYDIAKTHFPNKNKQERITLLLEVLQNINEMCKTESKQQEEELINALYRGEKMQNEITTGTKEVLQNLKISTSSEVIDILTTKCMDDLDEGSEMETFLIEAAEYMHGCFEVCWSMTLMKPQPDLYLNVRCLQIYNKDMFKQYIPDLSEKVDYVVWPALIVNGRHALNVLAKGVVKCLKLRHRSKTAIVGSVRKQINDREISQSARMIRKKKSARNVAKPLPVTNLTLHVIKNQRTRGLPDYRGQKNVGQQQSNRDLYRKSVQKISNLKKQGEKKLNIDIISEPKANRREGEEKRDCRFPKI